MITGIPRLLPSLTAFIKAHVKDIRYLPAHCVPVVWLCLAFVLSPKKYPSWALNPRIDGPQKPGAIATSKLSTALSLHQTPAKIKKNASLNIHI
jgi:hypothetical protein